MSTKEQVYALLRSRLDGVVGLPAEGAPGDEAVWALAAVFHRAGERAVNELREGRILNATLSGWGAGDITIEWADEWVNNIIIAVGSRIARTRWGVEFVLSEVPIGRSAAEPAGSETYAVQARWAGVEGNVPEDMVRDLVDTDLMTISVGVDAARAEWAAGIASGAIRITSSTAMTGGKSGLLALHAADAGQPVAVGETEAQVRRRLRARPGGITPNNIRAAVVAMLGTDDVQLLEPWVDGFAIGQSAVSLVPIWGSLRHALVVVPAGTDVEAVQTLVNQLRALGFYVQVIEGD